MTDERITRLEYLRDECDHYVMKSTFVLECARIFGCTLKPRKIDGGWMRPERPDEDCQGLPADEIVEAVCRQLRVPYEMKYGRGSQLRECCAKLIAFFGTDAAPPPRAKSVWPGKLRSGKE
jgi:hypothetical protein